MRSAIITALAVLAASTAGSSAGKAEAMAGADLESATEYVLLNVCFPLVENGISESEIIRSQHFRRADLPGWMSFSSSTGGPHYNSDRPDIDTFMLSHATCYASVKGDNYPALEQSVERVLASRSDGWHSVKSPQPLGGLVRRYCNGAGTFLVETGEEDPKRLPSMVAVGHATATFGISVRSVTNGGC